jgi:hypothetical protein
MHAAAASPLLTLAAPPAPPPPTPVPPAYNAAYVNREISPISTVTVCGVLSGSDAGEPTAGAGDEKTAPPPVSRWRTI